MKRVFLLIFSCLCCLVLVAQEKPDLTIGGNYSWVKLLNRNLSEDSELNFKTVFTPGFMGQVSFKPEKSKQAWFLGIGFNNYRAKWEDGTDSGNIRTRDLRLNYLEFPLGFRFDFQNMEGTRLLLGVQPGLLLTAKETSSHPSGSDTLNYNDRDVYASFEAFNLSAFLQLDREEKITESFSLRHGLQCRLGILDIVSEEGGKGMTYKMVKAYLPFKWLSAGYFISAVFKFD